MLNTKDIKTSMGNSTPIFLQPGNQKCTINAIELETFKFKEGGYNIVLHLEGPAQEDGFKGCYIDKNDESKGTYKGQIGKVKSSEYAYADGTTKGGTPVYRDEDMLRFLKNLCVALGINDWLVGQNNKHKTIESLFEAFNKDKPFKGIALDYCLAGREYVNKAGYVNYELFLPKFSKDGAPFGTSKVIEFKKEEHIKKKNTKPVTEFGDDNSPSTDFSKDMIDFD